MHEGRQRVFVMYASLISEPAQVAMRATGSGLANVLTDVRSDVQLVGLQSGCKNFVT